MIVFFRVFVLALVAFDRLSAQEPNNESPNRPKYISELQSDYLNAEQNLWNRIEQLLSADSSDSQRNQTLDEIAKVHRKVFFENTFESNNYWRSYLIFGIENLRDFLSNINGTLEENNGFLFDAAERFIYDSSKIEQWTRVSMFQRLKENANSLFDLTDSRRDAILQHIQNEAKCCTKYVKYVISEVQLVREYYANSAKALVRSYAMTQLAYMLMTLSAYRDSRAIAQTERKVFVERHNEFRKAIQYMLDNASRDLWKCNPNPYLDSRTYYTSITNFMQGYIDNQINLDASHTCANTCSDHKLTGKNYDCHNDTICAHHNFQKTRCTGEVFDCSSIESDGSVCLVKDEWEIRRYNYVKFQNGSMNGHDVMCFKAEQTQLSLLEESACKNCFCFCDEPGEKSDRYFSLRDATSDITANRIVTGIALKKINGVIQFVISERELYAYGKVNDTYRRSHVWKADDFQYLSSGKSDIDYFTLTRQHRSINLDTITLPLDKVVTGIRFRVHANRLYMEIRATDFDYKMGKLINIENSFWINNLNVDNEQRTQLTITDADSPIRTKNIQQRFDSNNKFIIFAPSDVKKDLAQSTVPFIESVALEASEPRPCSGVGLYYKGESGYGGFIAVKLIAYDTGEF